MGTLRTGISILPIKPEPAYPALKLAPPIQKKPYPAYNQANKHHSAKTADSQ